MLTLELDLIITYTPPMSENGGGIHLTRELQLPFAPFNGLQIYGNTMDQAPGPEGFILKDVIWDNDRQVFMAHSELCSHDLPMEEIPLDLKSWLDLGWRIGSYADYYKEPDYGEDEKDTNSEDEEDGDSFPVDEEFERTLKQPMLSPRQRPKELNLVMRAMVRAMVEVNNDNTAAYAMDKTKRYFTDHQLEQNDSKHARAWRDAQEEYIKMGWQKQSKWRERVMRTHPRLDKLVKRT